MESRTVGAAARCRTGPSGGYGYGGPDRCGPRHRPERALRAAGLSSRMERVTASTPSPGRMRRKRPGRPCNSCQSSRTSIQSPARKPSTSSRPRLSTTKRSPPSISVTRLATVAFSRDHLNVAVPGARRVDLDPVELVLQPLVARRGRQQARVGSPVDLDRWSVSRPPEGPIDVGPARRVLVVRRGTGGAADVREQPHLPYGLERAVVSTPTAFSTSSGSCRWVTSRCQTSRYARCGPPVRAGRLSIGGRRLVTGIEDR